MSVDRTRDVFDSDSDSGLDDSNISDITEACHCSDRPAPRSLALERDWVSRFLG